MSRPEVVVLVSFGTGTEGGVSGFDGVGCGTLGGLGLCVRERRE